MLTRIIVISLMLLSLSFSAHAESLPIPRFVSLKSDKINVRSGPGPQYPISWIMVRKDMPVEVTAEYSNWRQVKDIQGDEGWVHMAMLSGKRTAIIQNKNTNLHTKPSQTAPFSAVLEVGVIVTVESCANQFCEIEVEGLEGFVPMSALWGVYPKEHIK